MFHDILHLQSLSSCIGSSSCGVGTGADSDGIFFGATNISSANVAEAWLADSESAVTFAMTGSNQGAYNGYAAINTYWADTTNMDNLRGADITQNVAGTTETIGANTAANNVRGGHTVHTSTTNTIATYAQHPIAD